VHNREQFEVFCYSDVVSPDEVTDRIRTYSVQWQDIAGMTDEQAAALVRSDSIDILVDLAGHTAHNRRAAYIPVPHSVLQGAFGYV
jgi:protein O-GlcNAc transferase